MSNFIFIFFYISLPAMIILQISILEVAMTPMITAGVMASMLGLAPRLSNVIVGYGIVFYKLGNFCIYTLMTKYE